MFPLQMRPTSTVYVCGTCGQHIQLKPRDLVRCARCEGRILYKKQAAKTLRKYSAR
jgi:DNA-directed RNA polymerase subunit RPC12/RpoP